MSEEGMRELGRVDEVWLGVEDHGILTFNLGIDFGGSHQGFGGYVLQSNDEDLRAAAAGIDLLDRVIRLFGCEWSKIKGRIVYALRDAASGTIIGLELPAFEGDRKLLIADWRKKWFSK